MSAEEERKVSTYETYVSSPSERTVLLVKARDTNTWQDKIGLYEPTELNFWRLVLAEFLYTLLFTMFACGCVLRFGGASSRGYEIHQAMCVGGIVFVLVSCSFEKFGYFNPAVSFGLFVAQRISFVRFFVYVAVQIAGSCAGAGLLYLYTPEQYRGHLGTLSVNNDMVEGLGFMVELTLTFVVMMAVMATADPNKSLSHIQSPLVVGYAVFAAMLVGIPYTGAATNPIRAFGPAAITGNLTSEHWIYWVGPFLGAALASLAYDYVLTPVKASQSESSNKRNSDMPTIQLHIKNSNSSV